MKTNLVFRAKNSMSKLPFYKRAVIENKENEIELRRTHSVSVAKYAKPESVERASFNMRTMEISPSRQVVIPEGVAVSTPYTHYVFHFKRGVCNEVRFISDDYQQELDALDQEIEQHEQKIKELKAQRNDIIKNAFCSGRPLHRNKIVQEQDQ